MLTAMTLHASETFVKIYFAIYGYSCFYGIFGVVVYFTVFFMCVKNCGFADKSAIACLTASFGEKSGFVKRRKYENGKENFNYLFIKLCVCVV